MPSVVVSNKGPQQAHPIKLENFWCANFKWPYLSKYVWLCNGTGLILILHQIRIPNLQRTPSGHIYLMRYQPIKKLYTPKSAKNCPTPLLACLLTDPFILASSIPSYCITVVVQANLLVLLGETMVQSLTKNICCMFRISCPQHAYKGLFHISSMGINILP